MISVTFTERFCFIVFSDFLNTLITQSISKGFRILGCSIFKMPFVFFVIRSCRTTSLLYHIFSRLSSLFQNFFEIFFGSSFLAFVRHFLSYHIFFILSSTFQNFFSRIFSKFFALVRYLSVYHILSFLSRPFVIFFAVCFFTL